MDNQTQISSPGIHIMAKPAGPNCNLNCQYCYYLEKDILFTEKKTRMSDEILETFIKKYISSQPTPVVEFVWQGGEPTLMGIDFYEKVVRLQNKFNKGKEIINVLQTNGVNLDDAWCKFLKKNNFLVGLSLDGPEDIHNLYRTSPGGQPVFESVYKGLKNLQKHNVEFNVMASVAKETSYRPLDVYNFFRDEDVKFLQFLPIVERLPNSDAQKKGLHLSPPADLKGEENNIVTSWSVEPEAYGDFLIDICEEWVRNDVGKIFVMNFDWALSAWIGNPSPVCRFAKQCGRSIVMEHNGDIFACDHCVYPEYKLGNILSDDLLQMVDKSLTSGFGINKEDMLPQYCLECKVLGACQGECPKHRFVRTPDGHPGLNYLCAGYKKYFLHIRKYLQAIVQLMENGLPASHVMKAFDGPLMVKLKK